MKIDDKKNVKSDDKSTAILNAASKVFSSEGYHKAKITKIAEIAGIGAGTVYLYFESKEAILEEIFARAWARIEEKLINLQTTDISPKEKIIELINEIVSLAIANIDISKMILHEFSFWSSTAGNRVNAIVDNIQSLMIDIIEQGKIVKLFNKKINSKNTTIYIIGGIWAYLASISDDFHKIKKADIASSLSNIVLFGLS